MGKILLKRTKDYLGRVEILFFSFFSSVWKEPPKPLYLLNYEDKESKLQLLQQRKAFILQLWPVEVTTSIHCSCLYSAVSIQKCSHLSFCYMLQELTEHSVVHGAWHGALVCLSNLLRRGSAEYSGCDDMGQCSQVHLSKEIYFSKNSVSE